MHTPGHDLLARAERLPALSRLLAAVGPAFEPSLWLVGGAVRDLLLGADPLDVDLMVDGELEAVATVLGAPLTRHDAYLTGTAAGYDLARPRQETYRAPGALPQVSPADGVEADLRRRDFSVNAIAVGLTGPARGELVSVEGALKDLEARELRVLHDGSFRDDPTRLLRLARYAARLDFSVEAGTLGLVGAALADGALATVSGVRIGNELRKLAAEADPVRGFVALRELGIDGAVDPALGLLDDALATRALKLIEPGDRRDRLVLATALLGAPREYLVALLDRLGFGAEDREVIAGAAADAERVSRRLEYAGPPSEIDWAAGGPDAAAELVALAGAIHPANAAREWLVELRHRRLSITGADLLDAGVPAGPAVGVGLAAARAALLDDEATDAPSQLAVALAAAAAA
jgi:tRNA nucleotidyltransferase (CCA-adding enzyme)